MTRPFIKKPTDHWKHIGRGRLTLEEYAVWDTIAQLVYYKTRSWTGSALDLVRMFDLNIPGKEGTRKTKCKAILNSLREKGYISGQPNKGRGKYVMTIEKYFSTNPQASTDFHRKKGRVDGPSENKGRVDGPSEQEGPRGRPKDDSIYKVLDVNLDRDQNLDKTVGAATEPVSVENSAVEQEQDPMEIWKHVEAELRIIGQDHDMPSVAPMTAAQREARRQQLLNDFQNRRASHGD
jgi:hypothetical protein